MAEYSIILNLSGNAVEKTERLSASLATAASNAQLLTRSLSEVNAAARALPKTPIRVPRSQGTRAAATVNPSNPYLNPYRGGRGLIYERTRSGNMEWERTKQRLLLNRIQGNQSITNSSLSSASTSAVAKANTAAANAAAAFGNSLRRSTTAVNTNTSATSGNTSAKQRDTVATRNYTRHRSTQILSYGAGFNFGGFNGRFSNILQPDANNKIFGIDATKLSKSLNVAAIGTEIVSTIGKAILNVVKYSTLAPVVAGAAGVAIPLRVLQSESYAEGVRLISRRHQSRLGLGADYEQANINTDFLAAAYGLDRGTILSSINTLTGLGIGGSRDRTLSLDEATGISKIGGLISQHHGVPIERVLTNLQQLLVQDTPHIRDIRELLNQAPILGKYALREMESKGVNMDIREYLKDQKNLLSVLKSYELDVATNAGMQARGRVSLAQQDVWSKIAGEDGFWSLIGDKGSDVINALGGAAIALMRTLEGNSSFNVFITNISYALDNFANKGVKTVDKLITYLDRLSAVFGIDLGDRKAAREQVDRERAIKELYNSPDIRQPLYDQFVANSKNLPAEESAVKKAFEAFRSDLIRDAIRNGYNVTPLGEFNNLMDAPLWQRLQFTPDDNTSQAIANKSVYSSIQPLMDNLKKNHGYIFIKSPIGNNYATPESANAAYGATTFGLLNYASNFQKDRNSIGGLDLSLLPNKGGAGDDGSDISGLNRDRRSLTINFNAPLVDWQNTVMSGSAEQVTEEISNNIEEIVGVAIQRALLGSSNKLTSAWY